MRKSSHVLQKNLWIDPHSTIWFQSIYESWTTDSLDCWIVTWIPWKSSYTKKSAFSSRVLWRNEDIDCIFRIWGVLLLHFLNIIVPLIAFGWVCAYFMICIVCMISNLFQSSQVISKHSYCLKSVKLPKLDFCRRKNAVHVCDCLKIWADEATNKNLPASISAVVIPVQSYKGSNLLLSTFWIFARRGLHYVKYKVHHLRSDSSFISGRRIVTGTCSWTSAPLLNFKVKRSLILS